MCIYTCCNDNCILILTAYSIPTNYATGSLPEARRILGGSFFGNSREYGGEPELISAHLNSVTTCCQCVSAV